jgi:cobalamin biosynthesis Mg chelatase CobN
MKTTNSIPYSSIALAIALVCLVAVSGTATALSVTTTDVPSETEVGDDVSTTLTVEDPFTDQPDEWTLEGETELENVSWVVTVTDQGDQVNQEVYDGSSFTHDLTKSDGGDQVAVEVSGTAPEIENYSYAPEETYTLAALSTVQGDNVQEIESWSVHHFTNESQHARTTIAEAETLVNQTGPGAGAQRSIEQAISSYNTGNFENAISNADDATAAAKSAKQSQEQSQMLFMGGAGLAAVVVLGGGIYYWRSRQQTYDKLR